MPTALRLARTAFVFCAAALTWGCQHNRPAPPLEQRFPLASIFIEDARDVADPDAAPAIPSAIIQDAPIAPAALQAGPRLDLTIKDVLYTTLANNLDIRIEELNRQSARDGIEASKGIYDLTSRAIATFGKSFTGSRSYSEGRGAFFSRSQSFRTARDGFIEASLSQLIPSGGFLTAAYSFVRSRSDTETLDLAIGGETQSRSISYVRAFTLGFEQPLLRAFGRQVTDAPIRVARRDAEISYEAFRASVMNELSMALMAYWDLVFAVNNYDVQKLTLAQAEDLLRINTIRYEVGESPKTNVLQAQAQVASRVERVIQSRQDIQDVMDVLKDLMNLPHGSAQWNVQFVPLDKAEIFETCFDEETVLEEAKANRPDLRQVELVLDIRRIDLAVKKNAQLPQLNATGSVGYVSPDKERDYDYENYSVGLEFAFPLQNRAARAQHRQAVAQTQGAEITVERAYQAAFLDVRKKLRNLQTTRERTEATQKAVEYERANLKAERVSYDVGMSTSFEVLEFQEDFAQAQVSHILALVDYNKALIELELAKGTLLETYGVEVKEYGLAAAGAGSNAFPRF